MLFSSFFFGLRTVVLVIFLMMHSLLFGQSRPQSDFRSVYKLNELIQSIDTITLFEFVSRLESYDSFLLKSGGDSTELSKDVYEWKQKRAFNMLVEISDEQGYKWKDSELISVECMDVTIKKMEFRECLCSYSFGLEIIEVVAGFTTSDNSLFGIRSVR